MRVYIQDKLGDDNFTGVYGYSASLRALVNALKEDDGFYVTKDKDGHQKFIPFNRIQSIEEIY